MDDAVFQSSIAHGAASAMMELDYMDELLFEGCWLETTDGSSFIHQTPPSGPFFDSSTIWPMLDSINAKSSANLLHSSCPRDGTEALDLAESSTLIDSHVGSVVNKSTGQSLVCVAGTYDSNLSDTLFGDGSELNKLIWIEPRMNPTSSSVVERLIKALNYIKESAKSRDSLIQIWVPVNKGGTRVLTTIDQPFTLNSCSTQLACYRNISTNYVFAAQEDSSVSVGLPGRVFLGKVPEWTPDVRFFKVEEYPRVSHAYECDVRGTLALPVFEQGSRNCLGVIELVMTTQEINYRPEVENVCRALQAVHLQSSEFLSPQKTKETNFSYQAALPEILEVVRCACGSHGLPLAQAWVPCIQQGKEGCRHSNDNLSNCVSTVDFACFVADPCMQGFHSACSEHHLFKGQGVAGKAFLTNQPCFLPDITTRSKLEYPLSHHARMFGLCAAVAIRLRSIYTGNADFVLEFFLPTTCRDPEEQKKVLTSLSIVIQRVCKSLRVVTDKELEQEPSICNKKEMTILDNSPQRGTVLHVENNKFGSSKENSVGHAAIQDLSSIPSVPLKNGSAEVKQLKQDPQDSSIRGSPKRSSVDCSTVVEGSLAISMKSGERKRAKAEKTITLEVLRQHFAGSLKDAAKSIGVCPTTLKRICRQHGIKRWPSRKIKKVGHSLQKLQVVIDSVQGASGAFQIGSFYSNFPDLASPNLSGTSPFSDAKQCNPCHLPQTSQEHEGPPGSPRSATSKSPSLSGSQTSSSSQCCSSGTKQPTSTWNPSSSEDPLGGVNSHEFSLKRVRSEIRMAAPSEEGRKLSVRSQSQKCLVEHHNNGDNVRPPLPLPLPKWGGAVMEEGECWRAKVTYGEEKIRFRIVENWGLKDVVEEVVRRFNIGDMSGFHLKYLDDDNEWVLLTCDADLEECIDICRSSERQTMKLSLHVTQCHSRSSVGSNSQF